MSEPSSRSTLVGAPPEVAAIAIAFATSRPGGDRSVDALRLRRPIHPDRGHYLFEWYDLFSLGLPAGYFDMIGEWAGEHVE